MPQAFYRVGPGERPAAMLRSFADGRLFGATRGEGQPKVLVLHGWRRDHRDFDAVLADGDLPAVALDLPGFGATPEPPEAWGSAEYAEAVAPVLKEMGEAVVVLGHSFGGRVACHLGARYPEAVAALVLTGVPLLRLVPPRRSPWSFRLLRHLRRLHLIGEGPLDAARQRYGSPDYQAARGVMRQVFVRVVQETYEEQLKALRCPVALVWGERDLETPVEIARAAAPLVPSATLEVVPGVGHLTPLEAPEALGGAIRRFLS